MSNDIFDYIISYYDDAYFENLSSNFDKELSEEDALMSHSQDAAFLDDLNLQVSQKDMTL